VVDVVLGEKLDTDVDSVSLGLRLLVDEEPLDKLKSQEK